jgi:hypothetical protein
LATTKSTASGISFNINTQDDTIALIRNNKVIAIAKRGQNTGLFEIKQSDGNAKEISHKRSAKANKASSKMPKLGIIQEQKFRQAVAEWHNTLGHPSLSRLRILLKMGLVDRISIEVHDALYSSMATEVISQCETCLYTKATQHYYK